MLHTMTDSFWDQVAALLPKFTEQGLIITLICLVVLFVLFYFGRTFAKRLGDLLTAQKGTLHQVQNDHTTNLRVDLDEKHDEVGAALQALATGQGALLKAVQDIRDEQGGMREDVRENRRSILSIGDALTEHVKDARRIIRATELVDPT